jgi:predicted RNase H-like HicB family nuclease
MDLLAFDQRFRRPSHGAETRNEVKYRVVIEQDEDGMFVAECTSLPGCISQGKTRAEALANIKDAIVGYLESVKKHGDPLPPPISEEVVEVSV